MSTDSNNQIELVVYGEPASKSNTRKLVHIKGKMLFIKSQKALQYVKDFDKQCPQLKDLITCDLNTSVTELMEMMTEKKICPKIPL